MASDRYVLLGLGRARSAWFGNVSSWATSGAVPVEFAKCLSAADVRQRLGGLQPFSALVVEAGIVGLDRDLIDLALRAGVPTFVVDTASEPSNQWIELGAATVLAPSMVPSDLLFALSNHARVISRNVEDIAELVEQATAQTGKLIAVCGAGGTGASTVAIALAQGFADDVLQSNLVVLADLARNAEQAMLHDAGDVVPGIEELVEASRTRTPSVDNVRELTFPVAVRRYRLLLGQRRTTAWAAMPPLAVAESIRGLRRAFRTVICDITADFEGERDGGSADVEERNSLARNAADTADAVVVVGHAGMKGTHALARTLRDLLALGVRGNQLLPVIVKAPKDSRSRREISEALSHLVDAELAATVFLPERPIDQLLQDGGRLPKQIVDPTTKAVAAVLAAATSINLSSTSETPERIQPGSLGFLDEAS